MDMNNKFQRVFMKWLPLAIVTIVLAGTVYVAIQQNYRMSANDPQIQVAEDVAEAITSGTAAPDSIVPAAPTADMTKSLSTFLIIYSASGTPVGGSVALDGKIPTPPAGVFDNVKKHGQERLTWQPKAGVRMATVIVSFAGPESGYVLVGRSLEEVEARIMQLGLLVGLGTLVALILSFLAMFFMAGAGHGHAHEHHHDHEVPGLSGHNHNDSAV